MLAQADGEAICVCDFQDALGDEIVRRVEQLAHELNSSEGSTT